MKWTLWMIAFVALGFQSCKIEPTEIDYGNDVCYFCKMTIVDNQHAAELVTAKGKAFKYDAIECLVHDLNQRNDQVALLLICDYADPGTLVDAVAATYLISENLPSPMGADLTGFAVRKEAEKTQKEVGGDLYNWDQIRELLK